jgi:hypothetical protein
MTDTTKITIVIQISDDTVEEIVESAGSYIDYWSDGIDWGAGERYVTVHERQDDDDSKVISHRVPYSVIAYALGRLVDGEYTARADLVTAARRAALDASSIDAELADIIIQCAIFGHIVYG